MRRTLVIGNTLLFAACLSGCDDDPAAGGGADQPVAADGAVDQSPIDDMRPSDMTSAPDMSVDADMRAAVDMSVAADMDEADMRVAADMVAPDMVADMAEPDMAEPDMAEPDMAEPDMAEPDMAEPDMAVVDMAQPDMAGDACEALLGQPCERDFSEGCCDSGAVVVWCEGGTFQRANIPPDFFCNCFGEGEPPVEVACAVPGFVGVHASGWRPAGVVRLRRVA